MCVCKQLSQSRNRHIKWEESGVEPTTSQSQTAVLKYHGYGVQLVHCTRMQCIVSIISKADKFARSVHWAETHYGLGNGQHAVFPEDKGKSVRLKSTLMRFNIKPCNSPPVLQQHTL